MAGRIPEAIDLGRWIDEERLRALDVSVEIVPMSTLAHNMDIPYLESIGTNDRNLTPRMLIEQFAIEVPHATKVREADISYPIDIYYFCGQWIILDGVHRYTQHLMDGAREIAVRKIPASLIDQAKKTPDEFLQWQGLAD